MFSYPRLAGRVSTVSKGEFFYREGIGNTLPAMTKLKHLTVASSVHLHSYLVTFDFTEYCFMIGENVTNTK